MDHTAITLTPTEKTAVMRIIAESGITLETDREIRYLLFPRNENQITLRGLSFLANQYSILGRKLPGRLHHIARIEPIYFATHPETYPEMYNAIGVRIGYPFPSLWGTKTA